ncbi:MAG: hypothetical protein ACE149_05560 [Armatimonadota bacterium]
MSRLWVAGIAVCMLTCVVAAAGPAEAYPYYMTDMDIYPVGIVTPTEMVRGAGVNEEVQFVCSESWDTDCVCWGILGNPVLDDVTYTWSASGGTFPQGNTGMEVMWKAPSSPGNYTVTITVDDVAGHAPPAEGNDNDFPVSASITMEVLRLDAVHLYFYNNGTGYPYEDDDPFDTRAVVTITYPNGVQNDYCAWDFDPELTWWWAAGSEGPQGDDVVPPQTPPYLGEPAEYPSHWPFVDITWELMWHRGSDEHPTIQHARQYWYEPDPNNPYLSYSWGEDNRVYNAPGVHRLRATATIEAGTAWEQTVSSPDEEHELRICVKRHITGASDPQRNNYVEWISTYENVPYEWGGEGFGGKDSNDAWVGAPGTYDGYGMDCSGLVSCGAYRAGYNWNPWRATTVDLMSGYYTSGTPVDFGVGDLFVKSGAHVVSLS